MLPENPCKKNTLRSQKSLTLQIAVALACLAGHPLKSELVVYEPFDMPAGAKLHEQPAGAGLSGSWIQNDLHANPKSGMEVSRTPLNFGILPTSGNCGYKLDPIIVQASASIGNSLRDAGLLKDGSTLWISFLWKAGGTFSINAETSVCIGTAPIRGSHGTAMDNKGSGIGFNIKSLTGIAGATWLEGRRSNINPVKSAWNGGETRLIVGRVQWASNPGGKDTIDIFLPNTDFVLGDVICSDSAVLNQSGFNTLGIACKREAEAYIDEIRIGATYDDLISGAVPKINKPEIVKNDPPKNTNPTGTDKDKPDTTSTGTDKDTGPLTSNNNPPKPNVPQLPDGETILLTDNFERGAGNWDYSGASTLYDHLNGENHARTGRAAAMLASSSNKPGYITLSKPLVMQSRGARELYLSFDYKWHESGSKDARFTVEYSMDAGKTWKPMNAGYTSDTPKGSVFLDVVYGLTDEMLFRFVKKPDEGGEEYRVYIDNINVSAKR